MDLKHLRAFVAVAETLHFGRAAERLNVTQPALSGRVRALESGLGVSLLSRTTRRVALTLAGEAFLPEARATLARMETAIGVARRTGASGAERLRIGGVDSATAGLLPSVVRRFRNAHPHIDISVDEMLSARAVHALRHRQLDIGFTRVPADDEALHSRHVLDERLWVAVAAGHRLARQKAPRLAAVAAEPLVLPSRAHRPILTDIVHAFFESHGLAPEIRQAVDERHVAIAMVAAGLGVAIVPGWVRRFSGPDVHCFPLPGRPPPIRTHAVWRRGETLAAVHRFLEAIPAPAATD